MQEKAEKLEESIFDSIFKDAGYSRGVQFPVVDDEELKLRELKRLRNKLRKSIVVRKY